MGKVTVRTLAVRRGDRELVSGKITSSLSCNSLLTVRNDFFCDSENTPLRPTYCRSNLFVCYMLVINIHI